MNLRGMRDLNVLVRGIVKHLNRLFCLLKLVSRLSETRGVSFDFPLKRDPHIRLTPLVIAFRSDGTRVINQGTFSWHGSAWFRGASWEPEAHSFTSDCDDLERGELERQIRSVVDNCGVGEIAAGRPRAALSPHVEVVFDQDHLLSWPVDFTSVSDVSKV